jgi:hypothetical protein
MINQFPIGLHTVPLVVAFFKPHTDNYNSANTSLDSTVVPTAVWTFENLHVIVLICKQCYEFTASTEIALWCVLSNPYGAIGPIALPYIQFQFQCPCPCPCLCLCPCPCPCSCPCHYPCPYSCHFKYGVMNIYAFMAIILLIPKGWSGGAEP